VLSQAVTWVYVLSRIAAVTGQRLGSVVPWKLYALVLALAGIYGVLSYAVSRRTGEIGVRLALGASPGKVLRLIVGQGMRPVLVGLVVGIGASLALTRLMASLLFGISPTDLVTYSSVAALLSGAALLSCYVPARQALRVDVVAALRKE